MRAVGAGRFDGMLMVDGQICLDRWAERHALGTPVGRCGCGGSLSVVPGRDGRAWERDPRAFIFLTGSCEVCGSDLVAIHRPVKAEAVA